MSQVVTCKKCQRKFRVKDHQSGQPIRCRHCGRNATSGSRKGKSRKRSSRSAAVPYGPIVAGVGVLIVVVFGVYLFLKSGINLVDLADSTNQSTEQQHQANIESTRTVPAQAVEQPLERKLVEGSLKRLKSLNLGVTVTVTGVDATDDEAANKFLKERLQWALYLSEREYVNIKNEKSKQAAMERSAKTRVPEWYQVTSNTRIYRGLARDGTAQTPFRYYLAPVHDVKLLISKLKFGKITSSGGSSIHLHYELHDPVPTVGHAIAVEKHGAENVAHVRVTGALGDPKIVEQYLKLFTTPLGENLKSLTVFGIRKTGTGEFELWVAPVPDLSKFGAKIPWGKVSEIDKGKDRSLTVAAEFPNPFPTQTDIDLIVAADRIGQPRPGVDKIQWAMKAITIGQWPAMGNAVKILDYDPVQEEHREAVSSLLIETLFRDYTNPDAYAQNLNTHLHAMVKWKTSKTEDALIQFAVDQNNFSYVVLELLATLKTEKSIRELAAQLPVYENTFRVEKFLIKIGTDAESAVLKHLRSPEVYVRTSVYKILTEIGTEPTLELLTENAKKEKDPKMRAAAQLAIKTIRLRNK